MDAAEVRRTLAREGSLSLVEALLIEHQRHRRYGKLELVFRDGQVDHIREERIIKIDLPEKRAA